VKYIELIYLIVLLLADVATSLAYGAAPQETILSTTRFTGKNPSVRLKDICHFAGVRENQLVGYGLVVGLNGTGDTMASTPYTKESLTSMLERLGVNIRDGGVPSGKNIAAVMVTANLLAFARQGTRIDVTVSALGDAKDLRGGTLLVTPLLGADGEVYAVSQGSLAVSGYSVTGRGASQTKGVPTSGKIANGAIIEKEIGFQLTHLKTLSLTLNNPDFTTARRISDAINLHYKNAMAQAVDSSTVTLTVSPDHAKNLVGLMTEIEQINVEPDVSARVVIDDQNGVIAITSNVKISPIALTHGSFTVKIVETPQVYMPNQNQPQTVTNTNLTVGVPAATTTTAGVNPSDQINALVKKQEAQTALLKTQQGQQVDTFKALYPGATEDNNPELKQLTQQQAAQLATLNYNQQQEMNQLVITNQKDGSAATGNPGVQMQNGAVVVDSTDINTKEEKGKFAMLESGANLEEFVNALNALGATPRDMTAILQNIKAAGALQADIVVN
jgi:flagellar P-ring protein precursor FlgI